MNVGGKMDRFAEIRFARPKNGGEPGIPVDEAKPQSSRASIEDISRDSSEFSPAKVISASKIVDELESTHRLDKAHFIDYLNAATDPAVEKRLINEFLKPVFKYASNSGRKLHDIKTMMREAILEHIDIPNLRLNDKVRLRQELLVSPIRREELALVA
jgi:hypothetical protein